MSDQDDDSGWADYESGPFCRHFSDPNDCEEVCAQCGHRCHRHAYSDGDTFCLEGDCDCQAWIEKGDD